MRLLREGTATARGATGAPDAARRHVLLAALGGAAAAVGGTWLPPFARAATAGAPANPTERLGYLQGVELFVAGCYGGISAAVGDGTRPLVDLIEAHHYEHAEAFGALAGDDAVAASNPGLIDLLVPELESLTLGDTPEPVLLRFAARLERQLAATQELLLLGLGTPEAVATGAAVVPVECGHAAALTLAAGDLGVESLFPEGALTSPAFGDGTDPDAGYDPEVFGT